VWVCHRVHSFSLKICAYDTEISVCDTRMAWAVVHTQILVACTQIADLASISANSELGTNNLKRALLCF
jgi:hypothetical protein